MINGITFNLLVLAIAVAPIMLWVAAEVTNARLTFRIIGGLLALAMTGIVVNWATSFTPIHEQAAIRLSMRRLEENLKQGNSNLAFQAIAEFNRTESTGDSFTAACLLAKKLEAIK